MKKSWTKRNRVFLNTPASGCMAGVSWTVSYTAPHKVKKGLEDLYEGNERLKSGRAKAHMSAHCEINDAAQEYYISEKGHLRALRNMRREIDIFEDMCLKALADKEDANAES